MFGQIKTTSGRTGTEKVNNNRRQQLSLFCE